MFGTKLEYVFDAEKPLEGAIVAADRVFIYRSSLVFLAAIPPERVGGARSTFYIGLAVTALGCVPTAVIQDRFRYLGLAYDLRKSTPGAHTENIKADSTEADTEKQ